MVYHPVDFDIDDFLSRIQGNKPPFICPSETCKKICKSYSYMQKHMMIHRPPDPIDIPAPLANGDSSTNTAFVPTLKSSDTLPVDLNFSENIPYISHSHQKPTTTMVFTDSRTSVVFEATPATKGQTFRCNIFVPLTIRLTSVDENSPNEFDSLDCSSLKSDTTRNEISLPENSSKQCQANRSKISKSKNKGRNKISKNCSLVHQNPSSTPCSNHKINNQGNGTETHNVLELPKAQFTIDPEFTIRKPVNIKEGSGYIRFIEQSTDELDEIVEYDLDEEDLFWLERINLERKRASLSPVTESTLEWIMDRFEKKARFRLSSENGGEAVDAYPLPSGGHSAIDEDAVCAVCQDGTCENTNVILFCDVCNLAVHQECYGVPYVPEGQWLCRKCLHSPSEPVSCVLCPNRGGAFKKTTDDRWAHVICGLWVPEVMFANLTFLEPLEGIDRIAPARWKLQCFICKQRNVGACIQCHKSSCYRAFHVTCAQHAGLYMKIEHTDDTDDAGIRKNAFCDQHCPPDHFTSSNKGMYAHSDSESPQSPEQAVRIQMRKARKVLAERRNSKPSVCVPIVSKARMELILSKLSGVSGDKMAFLKEAYAFWKLKREFRRGVPLLKRLQASSVHRNAANFAAAATTGDVESQKMRAQLKFWQQLRQDLEKARLLAELTRKRERIKRDIFSTFINEVDLRTQPWIMFQLHLLDQLQVLDTQQFFAEPVSPSLAPDYSWIIKEPMDFSTMRKKIRNFEYSTIHDMIADFQLMLENCFHYNRESSIYYTSALKLRDQSSFILTEAINMYKQLNFCPKTGLILEIMNNFSNQTGKQFQSSNISSTGSYSSGTLTTTILNAVTTNATTTTTATTTCVSNLVNNQNSEIVKVVKENIGISNNDSNHNNNKKSQSKYTSLLSLSSSSPSSLLLLSNNSEFQHYSFAVKSNRPHPNRINGPLKELANCKQTNSLNNNINNNNNLRSRLRSYNPISSTSITHTNKDLGFDNQKSKHNIDSPIVVNHSRKRRYSSVSNVHKPQMSPKSPNGDGRRSSKHARLNSAFLQTASKQPQLVNDATSNYDTKFISEHCKWNYSGALTEDTASCLLARVAESRHSGTTRSPTEINGLTAPRNGPAFTRYRTGRVSRGDDDDEEDDSEESDDEESDDGSFTYSNPPSSTPNHHCENERSSRRQQRSKDDSSSKNNSTSCALVHPITTNTATTTTTVIGMSRLAYGPKTFRLRRLKKLYKPKCASNRHNKCKLRRTNLCNYKHHFGKLKSIETHQTNTQSYDNTNHDITTSATTTNIEDMDHNCNSVNPTIDNTNSNINNNNHNNNNMENCDLANSTHNFELSEYSCVNVNSQTLFNKFLENNDGKSNTIEHSDSKDEHIDPATHHDQSSLSLATECSDNTYPHDSTGPLSSSASMEPYEIGILSTDSNSHCVRSPISKVSSRGSIIDELSTSQRFSALDVVWAKYLGSPWYPALIVDPDAREGYAHNGVPIPVPPETVLNLGKRMFSNKSVDESDLLLVLFFDTKRTWQWLSPQKLQLLGVNKELDRERLKEGKRSKMKHSVTKAYRRAVEHMCKVHGRLYPYSEGKSNEITIFTL